MEKLKFRLTLSGTYTSKAPDYTILLGGIPILIGTVSVPSGERFVYEFERELEDTASYKLEVRLRNKDNRTDTVVDEQGNIVSDLLLNVEDVEIDGISLGNLLHTKSLFHLDQPQTINESTVTELKNCVNLGFNGSWSLEFTTPFYLWLLENL